MRTYGIYIPSKGRADNQITIHNLPNSVIAKTTIVVPKGEGTEYGKHLLGEWTSKCGIIEVTAKGIAATRQWIMENAQEDYIIFLDDDMSFHVRTMGVKLEPATHEDIIEMIRLLTSWLDGGFLHVGISQRAGNNRVTEAYTEITRMNNAYAYNRKAFLTSGARFDNTVVMEDFDATLTLLKAGYPNRVTYQYTWSQVKSGMAGGCSTYRTFEVQKEAALALAKKFPGLVRVVQKEAGQEWEGVGKTRYDVVISWKEAYAQGQAARNKTTKSGINKFF